MGQYGRLGNGGTSDQYTPTLTSSFGNGRVAIAISSGSLLTCAVLDDLSARCWGQGHGTTPSTVSGLGTNTDVVAISAGESMLVHSWPQAMYRVGARVTWANSETEIMPIVVQRFQQPVLVPEGMQQQYQQGATIPVHFWIMAAYPVGARADMVNLVMEYA